MPLSLGFGAPVWGGDARLTQGQSPELTVYLRGVGGWWFEGSVSRELWRLEALLEEARGGWGKGSWVLSGLSHPQEQRSAVFVVLFALVTILILYSSSSANEVFHYGSLGGRSRRPVNLKKWSYASAYVPLLGNKVEPPRGGACRAGPLRGHGALCPPLLHLLLPLHLPLPKPTPPCYRQD